MFGGDVALKAFRKALCHVTKSGEVWCEGARIFLDPCCRAFDLLNASKCLNYAVFFTPQYGDTFIEAIKLLILSSERFLEFHACANPCVLSYLLRSLPEIALFIKRASFFEPNYGFLWFRAQPFMQSPLKEVLYTSLLTISRRSRSTPLSTTRPCEPVAEPPSGSVQSVQSARRLRASWLWARAEPRSREAL